MPRRLNSEMRALIPFKLNSEYHLEKRQDHNIVNERCEDMHRMPRKRNSEMRALIPFKLNTT
jgi:hypothetical protein